MPRMEECARCGHKKDEHFIIGGCQYEWPMHPFKRCFCDGFEYKVVEEKEETKTE